MYFARIYAVVCAALTLSVTAGPCANQDQEQQQQQHQLLLQSDAVQWRTGFDDRKPPGAPGPPGPRPPLPPHPHHEPPNVENKTIFQALSEEPRFSRVFKLVNLTEEITSTLNDSSASVTFFAVPDWALHPPKHPKHDPPPPGGPPGPPHHDEEGDEESIISNILANPDEIERFTMLESLMLEQSEDDDDHKKKVIKKIIRAVLSYHILPTALPAAELGKNLTHPTSLKLKDGSLDGQALRIRVAVSPKPFRPAITVNMFAKVVLPDIKAKNGFIHVVNHPIGPPPSAFQILFLVSDVFSTFTSALQRVGLTDAVDWRWIPGDDDEKGTLDGTPSLTVFAPTNKAFANLPPKLRFFLFSPFGEWVLKKLLEFHIAPDYILHSNWQHNASDAISEERFVFCGDYIEDDFPIDEVFSLDYLVNSPAESGRHHTRSFTEKLTKLRSLFDGSSRPNPPHGPPPPGPPPHGPAPPPGPPPPPGPHHEPPHPPKRPHFPHPDPIYSLDLTVPTLLTNHSLSVHIDQFEHRLPLPPHKSVYPTRVIVEGQHVLPDLVTRNGALHVVGKLLNPVKRHPGKPDQFGDDDEWAGWEDWLLKWAAAN